MAAGEVDLKVIITAINQTKEVLGQVGNDLNKTFGDMSKGVGGLISIFRTATTALKGFIGYEIIQHFREFTQHLAEGAARAEELGKGMLLIGQNAGFTTDAIREADEAIQKLGVSTDVTRKNLTRLYTEGVSPDTAQKLGTMARTLSITYGKSIDETFADLVRSVSRGTTRNLQIQYGIALNAQQVFLEKSRELGRPLFTDERQIALAEALVKYSQKLGTPELDTTIEKETLLKKAQSDLAQHIGEILIPAYRAWLNVLLGINQELDRVITHPQTPSDIRRMRLGVETPEGPKKAREEEAIGYQDVRDIRASKTYQAFITTLLQRAGEDLKRVHALEKQKADEVIERLKTEQEATKQYGAAAEKSDQDRYDRGTLTLDDFYKNKRSRLEADYTAEKKVNAAILVEAKAQEARLQKEAPGSVGAIGAAAAVVKAQETITRAVVKNTTDRAVLYLQEYQEQEKNRRAFQDQIDLQREAADTHDLQAALDTLTHKYERLRETLHDVDGMRTAGLAAFAREQRAIEIQNKLLTDTAALNDAVLKAKRAQLALEFGRGELTTTENQNRANALTREEIEDKRKLLVATYTQTNATVEGQRKQELAVKQLEADIAVAEDKLITYGKQIRQTFTTDLASAIQSVLDKSKTVTGAIRDLVVATRNQLLGIFSKNVAEQSVQLIVKLGTEAGFGNIFEKLGALLGDKGTEFNPMIVEFSKRMQFLMQGGAPGSAAGLAGLLRFNSGGLGTGMTPEIADMLPWASGGLIGGPSHARGGVAITAEGGEYVINKRQTAKWAGLLAAINSGALDNLHIATGRKRFESGGLVPAPSSDTGSTHVNITINDGQASASGNTAKASVFAKHAASLIQAELIRQKRAGGLLA